MNWKQGVLLCASLTCASCKEDVSARNPAAMQRGFDCSTTDYNEIREKMRQLARTFELSIDDGYFAPAKMKMPLEDSATRLYINWIEPRAYVGLFKDKGRRPNQRDEEMFSSVMAAFDNCRLLPHPALWV